jgi:hypothetical protein
MSQPIVNAVWRSDLPDFLKRGVVGKLAALADDGGQFNQPGKPRLTMNYLVNHCRYGKDSRRLCRQTIKNQVRAAERCGFLTIVSHGAGRGHYRTYELHPDALTTVQADDPMLRPAHRRVGKGPEGRILVATRKNWKGDNKGPTEAETPEISPDLHENEQPPPGANWPPGSRPLRWDAVRTTNKNHKVMVKLAHTMYDGMMENGESQLSEFEILDRFKWRTASALPGQTLHTGQLLAALDAAAYRRHMLGIPLPANAGSNGQRAFRQDRQQHKGAGHAVRMDAR